MAIQDDLRKIILQPRGQCNHDWIYWKAYGKRMRRPYVIPFDPKTLKQIEVRNKMYIIGKWYKALTAEQKQFYDDEAKRKRLVMTGYNYFFKLKFKEVTVMVKQVIHGSAPVVNGLNTITIPEIIIAKTLLFYGTYGVGATASIKGFTGILNAVFLSSTQIQVEAVDEKASGAVVFCYQLVEYV